MSQEIETAEPAEEATEEEAEDQEVILARAEGVADPPEALKAKLAELSELEAELEAPLRELERRRQQLEQLRAEKAQAELDLARHRHADWWEKQVDEFAAVHEEAAACWRELEGPLTAVLERLLTEYDEKRIRAKSAWNALRHLVDVKGSPYLKDLTPHQRWSLMRLPTREGLDHLREAPLDDLVRDLLVDLEIRLQQQRREEGLPRFRTTMSGRGKR